MSDLQRVKKVIDWLVFEGIAESQKDVAEKCGYGESYMSQVLSGRVNLSSRFIKNLVMLDERLSEEWIATGEGDMLRNGVSNVQSGNGNNNQQGQAGHDLTQNNNSQEIFVGFIEALKGEQAIAIKSMGQTDKALEEIAEHRKQTDKVLDMLRASMNISE